MMFVVKCFLTVLVVLNLLNFAAALAQLAKGQVCNLKSGQGICRDLGSCPPVWMPYVFSNQQPELICDNNGDGSNPVVCCPASYVGTTQPTTTTSITTTTPTTPTSTTTPTTTTINTTPTIKTTVVPDKTGPADKRPAEIMCSRYARQMQSGNEPLCTSKLKEPINDGLVEAVPREFPHMAAIGYNSSEGIEWLCAGSLISENFVLATANCITGNDYRKTFFSNQPTWVRVGDLNLNDTTDDARTQVRGIAEIITYPLYNKHRSMYNDIGLVKLDSPVTFDDYVKPACLSVVPRFSDGHNAVYVTWTWNLKGDAVDRMWKVAVSTKSHTKCIYQSLQSFPNGIDDYSQLCGGYYVDEMILGDIGGPLIVDNINEACMYDIIGIASLTGVETIYSRVNYYISWIEDIVWPNSNDTTSTTVVPEMTLPVDKRPSEIMCSRYARQMQSGNEPLCASKLKEPISGGRSQAAPKEFPHMAAVGYDSSKGIEWLCAGSLISENFVLATANCITGNDLPPKWVRMGDLKLNDTTEDARPQVRGIAEIIKYPKYKLVFKYHDIGLLKLDSPVTFDSYVRPACLSVVPRFPDGHNAVYVTWAWDDEMDTFNEMWKSNVSTISYAECYYLAAQKAQFYIDDNSQLCGRYHENTTELVVDVQKETTGGPLIADNTKEECMYEIIGIVSLSGTVEVYTRVYNYLSWIEGIVWPNFSGMERLIV